MIFGGIAIIILLIAFMFVLSFIKDDDEIPTK